MKKVPHVLLVMPTANFSHRQAMEGALGYMTAHTPWQLHVVNNEFYEQGLRSLRKWGCDGVIALVHSRDQMQAILDVGCPAVFINPPFLTRRRNVCVFRRDNERIGTCAAEFYLGRGYANFAFIGSSKPTYWSDGRLTGFRKALAAKGFSPIVYPPTTPEEADDFGLESPRLVAWLKSLPHQTALLTVRDLRGIQVLNCCLEANRKVPEEISVLSVDDDRLLCETAIPKLSSIPLDSHRTGYRMAETLDRLMSGQSVPNHVMLNQVCIVERESTDANCIADALVARACSLLREDLSAPFNVNRLARRLHCSARTLELRARRQLGMTLREHFIRLRLYEAVRLLKATDWTNDRIATAVGFCDASHFGVAFKKRHGTSPGVIRDRNAR